MTGWRKKQIANLQRKDFQMEDEQDFLYRMQQKSNETMMSGCLTYIGWLGYSNKDMMRTAGDWVTSITVEDLDRLIDLARGQQ